MLCDVVNELVVTVSVVFQYELEDRCDEFTDDPTSH